MLAAAGFTRVGVRAVDATLSPPDDPDTVAEWLIEVGPAGAAYRAAHPDQRAKARRGVTELLERFRAPGATYRLPAGIWLLTATAPTR